jgi:hypothetical protein
MAWCDADTVGGYGALLGCKDVQSNSRTWRWNDWDGHEMDFAGARTVDQTGALATCRHNASWLRERVFTDMQGINIREVVNETDH